MSGTNHSEIQALIDVSARLGRDPLLVQAGSGNTSVKLDGVLWIKASGKWLAHAAREEILVPVDLVEIKSCIQRKKDFVAQYTSPSGHRLVPSIETAMHAVVPRAYRLFQSTSRRDTNRNAGKSRMSFKRMSRSGTTTS